MRTAFVCRHGESDFSARHRCNGDPTVPAHLTARGREQAERLGGYLREEPVELCITSQFPRAQQTADIALLNREVPRFVEARLNDVAYGAFEGEPETDYHAWAREHDLAAAPPGNGEARVHVLARCCSAMLELVDRPEQVILIVTHELVVTYMLNGLHGEQPAAIAANIEPATAYRFTEAELERSAMALQDWMSSSDERGE